jgi:sugar O-acyltransferase (sialic acid O-acetyltransferase NeuD family)
VTIPLVILGAGGFARETLDIVDAINAIAPRYDMLGFLVDARYGTAGALVNDRPILGDTTWLADHPDVQVICGVGAPEVRRRLVLAAEQHGAAFAALVHPTAMLTRWVQVGAGTIITAGCILTNQIVLGRHVHVNLDCTIGHDARLDDYATLAPGVHVSGRAHINEGAYVGTGANLIEGMAIGAWSVVGAGATVTQPVPSNTTAVGVPARVIKARPEGWHLHEAPAG